MHQLTMLAPKKKSQSAENAVGGKQSPNKYRVTLASKSFGSVHMIEAEMVIRAADDFGENVICPLALAAALLMQKMGRQGEEAEPTIVQIGRLGINRPLDNGKLDLVELFTFDADSLR